MRFSPPRKDRDPAFQPHVITIGEALVEVMREDKQTPLDQPGIFLGPFASGAPAIFAVAAARLGLRTGFIGSIGADGFGRMLGDRLRVEEVSVEFLREQPGYTTGTAFVAYAADGSREFVFHLRHSAAAIITQDQVIREYFSNVAWLHISGSTLFLSEACSEACALAMRFTKDAGGKISLDPNLRPELMSLTSARTALEPFLETADLLLPTAEEAHLLTGLEDDAAAAQALLRGKDRIVVFKRGAAGATVYTQDCRSDVSGFKVAEVDPTGAGDSFNAAFIYALETGQSTSAAGQFAAAAGAAAVTQQGPMEGAPALTEVHELLSTARLVNPQEGA